MTIGLGIIRRLLVEKKNPSVLSDDYCITHDCFQEGDELFTFGYIYDHFVKFGQTPALSTVEKECKVSFDKLADEPMGYWAGKLIQRKQSITLLEMNKLIKDRIASGDVDGAIDVTRNTLFQLGANKSSDRIYTLGELGNPAIEKHNKRQRSSRISGVPFGVPYVDKVSDGAQNGDSIAFVGSTGVGKSYFLFNSALYAFTQGYRVFVVPTEMAIPQTATRFQAMYANVSPTLLKHGRMSYFGMKRFRDKISELETSENQIYFMESGLYTTIESIGLRIQEIKPHIVYIDGGYLLQHNQKGSEKRWERVTTIAEIIKSMAKEFNIPFVTSYQYNAKGAGLGNIGGSIAVSQLASIVFSIENENNQDAIQWTSSVYKLLKLIKGRDGESGEVRMLYDMARASIKQESVVSGDRGGVYQNDNM